MNELRDSVNSLGIADPEAAVSAHALLGADPGLRARAEGLPRTQPEVAAWVQANFLRPGSPFLEAAASSVADALGEAPDEAVHRILSHVLTRPRTREDLRPPTGLSTADLDALLPRLEAAGLVRAEANPLDPDDPFWTMDARLPRFHYAMLHDHLPRWRRGYITELMWRRTHARFDRYVCRPEFLRLVREWALGLPGAAETTRIVVPDPRFRQLRTLELAAWDADGALVALGTVRWRFRMVERQLKRMRYVRRLLGDPPARLYCVASRFDQAITADTDPGLALATPERILAGQARPPGDRGPDRTAPEQPSEEPDPEPPEGD